MLKILRRISDRILILTNSAIVIAYLAACWLPGLDPAIWPQGGFLSLILPYLLCLLVLHGLLWLFIKPLRLLPTLVILLVTYGNIGQVIPIHPRSGFGQKASGTLRVMTWNLRFFTPFHKEYSDNGGAIRHGLAFDEVKRFSPDVLCFQEFTDGAKTAGNDPVEYLAEKMGYRYHFFPGDDLFKGTVLNGTAIFSKYPILHAGQIRYADRFPNNEHMLWADILWNSDTVRVHVMHLQSYRFQPRDYRTIRKMRDDSERGQRGAILMYRKLRRTFIDHGEQSRWLRGIVDTSRHPSIVCADLNNVPGSFAYRTLLGDGKDAFAEKGSGFGRTYDSPLSRWMGMLPTLRIDYILTDKLFETVQVTRGKARLSDHRAVITDLRLPQKR